MALISSGRYLWLRQVPAPLFPASIYFYDPNGIRLEFARQPDDGEVVSGVMQTWAVARSELATLSGVTPEWIEKRLAALPD